LIGSANPALVGKKGSAFSQNTAPRQTSAGARSGAQLADISTPASVSSPAVTNAPDAISAHVVDKICDDTR
jgi:hypothetical protein